jgi:hypothetical protein
LDNSATFCGNSAAINFICQKGNAKKIAPFLFFFIPIFQMIQFSYINYIKESIIFVPHQHNMGQGSAPTGHKRLNTTQSARDSAILRADQSFH